MKDRTCMADGCERLAVAKRYCNMHYKRILRAGEPGEPTPRIIKGAVAPLCTVTGCDKQSAARGWCSMHYARWRKHGDPNYMRPKPTQSVCSIQGCDKPAEARGWCDTHWMRWNRWGDPLGTAPPRPGRLPCSVDGCGKESRAWGLCQGHYVRRKKHSGDSITTPLLPRYRTVEICAVDGCERKAKARNWCKKHWRRWRRTGDPEGLTIPGVYDQSKAQVYIIQHYELNAGKVGLAGCGRARLQEHILRGWEILWLSPVMLRIDAAGLEASLLEIIKTRGYLPPSDLPQRGWTETFDADELPSVLAQTRKAIRCSV